MSKNTPTFQVGDRVYTEKFGAGMVIRISVYAEMSTLVQFDKAGDPLHSGMCSGEEQSCWWFYPEGVDDDGTKIVLVIRKKADNR